MWGNVQWGRWWRTTRILFFPQHFWTSHVRPNQFQQIRVYHAVSGYRAASWTWSSSMAFACNSAAVDTHEGIPVSIMVIPVDDAQICLYNFGWREGVEPIQNDNREKCKLYFQPSLLLILTFTFVGHIHVYQILSLIPALPKLTKWKLQNV